MAESEEEFKSLLIKVKEESEKVSLKLNIQKTNIMASYSITLWQIDGETMEVVRDFIFLGSKITADNDYNHKIKRHLLLGRKAMTNLHSILKNRDITLPTKVHLVKAMDFPVVMYGCESWTLKNAECRRIDAFELWCWRRLESLLYCCCCCWVTSVMSDSVRLHRQKPTRLPSPWDSPGKNSGVGCHFLLQCMKVKIEVAQSCPTLSDPMDCSLRGSSIHGIFQARVLEWGAIAFSVLYCKEIQPVNSKGNQSWIFIGRTDAEAEIPILWPPDEKKWLIGKDPVAGKDWRQKDRGWQRMRSLDGHEFEQVLGVGDVLGSLACCTHRVARSQTWLNDETELEVRGIKIVTGQGKSIDQQVRTSTKKN